MGARSFVNPELQFVLQRLREDTSKPVAVGFGISEPEHVRQLSAWGADGVIVGSALVQRLGEAMSPSEGLRAMEAHARSLIAALP